MNNQSAWDVFLTVTTHAALIVPIFFLVLVMVMLIGAIWISLRREIRKFKHLRAVDVQLAKMEAARSARQQERLKRFASTGELEPETPKGRVKNLSRGTNLIVAKPTEKQRREAEAGTKPELEALCAQFEVEVNIDRRNQTITVTDQRETGMSAMERIYLLDSDLLLFGTHDMWKRELRRVRLSIFNRRAKRHAARRQMTKKAA